MKEIVKHQFIISFFLTNTVGQYLEIAKDFFLGRNKPAQKGHHMKGKGKMSCSVNPSVFYVCLLSVTCIRFSELWDVISHLSGEV